MLFPTITFTSFFLIFLLIWWGVLSQNTSIKVRQIILLVGSLVFYAFTDWRFVGVLLGVGVLTSFGGKWLDQSDGVARRYKGFSLISLLLLHLIGWKYTQWLVVERNNLSDAWGWEAWNIPEWAYPVGLSFFTFHALAILVGIWHRRLRPDTLLATCTHISFFPCLLAGPVLRGDSIAPRLRQQFIFHDVKWLKAIGLIMLGMTFKWVLSTEAANWSDPVFQDMADSVVAVWLGVHGYALQIFFDFAGYSWMAIGLAMMLGFSLPDNFTQPYQAKSLQQFWRSWHRSLSFFFRDHFYIDTLGGNKHGPRIALLSAFFTMLVSGVWHGANLTFIVWGAWHGSFLVLEKYFPKHDRWPSFMAWLVTFELVVWGWVWFRAEDVESAQHIFNQAFTVELPLWSPLSWNVLVWGIVMAVFIKYEQVFLRSWERISSHLDRPSGSQSLLTNLAMTLLLAGWACAIIALGPVGVPPFIYNGF